MIRVIEGLPENVLGVEATGRVTGRDYERVLEPALRERRAAQPKVRFVYVLGAGFEGWSPDAAWEDLMVGLKDPRGWEKVAVVTDKEWVRHGVTAFGWMIPGEVRVFAPGERAAAVAWAAA
ncbi:MAG TPA: STAS/SEC14 domain-containing protein [Myxococcaceae bacterium]|jgi:hypothetical protein